MTQNLLSTGSSRLNLAMSNNIYGGIKPGTYWNCIGKSSAGKTFLAFTSMAEASVDPYFKTYDLIFDDAEQANQFDIEKLFGKKLKSRIKSPSEALGMKKKDIIGNGSSRTIQNFRDFIVKLTRKEKPFIYILDSMDALSSDESKERTEKAVDTGEQAGSYKMEIAKLMGEILKELIGYLEETGSILIILSQTKQNIGSVGSRRSGGDSMKYYATFETWLTHFAPITKTINKQKLIIGTTSKCKLSKNKLTGALWNDLFMSIFWSYGIDDTLDMINYLVEQGHWEKVGRSIVAPEFDIKCTIDKLINIIENEDPEIHKENITKLKGIMQSVWDNVLDSMVLQRKPKYA